MKNIRKDFELLKTTTYLDSAAGALKPPVVLQSMNDFYSKYPINPHSIDSKFGVIVNNKVVETRKLVAKLINASHEEIIFTSGTTDSINKFASMIESLVKKDDEIVISVYNHSSNLVPWIEVAKKVKAKIIISKDVIKDITSKTKIVAYAQENNTIYQKNDVKKIYDKAKKVGAIVFNDAAQAIVHEKVDMKYFDALAFSGNKLYGPTGIGVLAVKKELLAKLKPSSFGGGAVATMNDSKWTSKDGVDAFEPGTLNTAGIIGLGEAIKYFNIIFKDGLEAHETSLAEYTFDKLSAMKNVTIYSKRGDRITLFNVNGVHSQDVVSALGHKGIILRSGEHCAKLLKQAVDTNSSVRVSLAGYNNKADIDKMIKALKEGDFLAFL